MKTVLLVLTLFLLLASCGRQGDPQAPEGSPQTYPRTYPTQ